MKQIPLRLGRYLTQEERAELRRQHPPDPVKWSHWPAELERMRQPAFRKWFADVLAMSPTGFIRKAITPQMEAWARKLADRPANHSTFIKRLDRHGDNCLRGHLLEAVFKAVYPLALYVGDIETGHDFEVDEKKIDVKCRGINVDPRPHYWIHVPEVDIRRRCEGVIYVFGFVNMKRLDGFLVGWEKGEVFKESAEIHREGERQAETNMIYNYARYVKRVSELKPMRDL